MDVHCAQIDYDVGVIGAGPAGVSCAVWLKRMGINVVLFDSSNHVGGLCARNPFEDEWNVTTPGLIGRQVAEQLRISLLKAKLDCHLEHAILKIKLVKQPIRFFELTVQNTQPLWIQSDVEQAISKADEIQTLKVKYVVLATGVTYRTAPEMGANQYPNIIVGSGQQIKNYDFSGKKVAVLGGGDNAFENAILAQKNGAKEVKIFARSVRAQNHWVEQFGLGQVHTGSYVFEPVQKMVNQESFDVILILYGYAPRIELLQDLNVELDNQLFVKTDFATMQTNVEGLYAIGELTRRLHPCVVSAMADGITAAKAIETLEFRKTI